MPCLLVGRSVGRSVGPPTVSVHFFRKVCTHWNEINSICSKMPTPLPWEAAKSTMNLTRTKKSKVYKISSKKIYKLSEY